MGWCRVGGRVGVGAKVGWGGVGMGMVGVGLGVQRVVVCRVSGMVG